MNRFEKRSTKPSDPMILEATEVDPKIAVDPFTGGDFKIFESSTCSVYSVGPDQVDDEGLIKLEYVRAAPALKGDIVFDLADKVAFKCD